MGQSSVLAAALCMVTTLGNAGEVFREVSTGRPSLIRRYFSWKADCTYRSFSLDITSRPRHGTLEPKFGDLVLTDSDVRGGELGACTGKSIRVVELHYTSASGFKGRDVFSVRVSAEGMPTLTDDYAIDVR